MSILIYFMNPQVETVLDRLLHIRPTALSLTCGQEETQIKPHTLLFLDDGLPQPTLNRN